jgi:hypothetical protein
MTSQSRAGEDRTLNRAELQKMTEERIKDARVLLQGKRWSYAYYVTGYAVECGLKSCVLAQMIHTGWVFQEKVKVEECLTHEFGKLVQIAGLTDELNKLLAASTAAGKEFVGNWTTALQWKVTSRYEAKKKTEAEKLYAAITDKPNGVFLWIKKYW